MNDTEMAVRFSKFHRYVDYNFDDNPEIHKEVRAKIKERRVSSVGEAFDILGEVLASKQGSPTDPIEFQGYHFDGSGDNPADEHKIYT